MNDIVFDILYCFVFVITGIGILAGIDGFHESGSKGCIFRIILITSLYLFIRLLIYRY